MLDQTLAPPPQTPPKSNKKDLRNFLQRITIVADHRIMNILLIRFLDIEGIAPASHQHPAFYRVIPSSLFIDGPETQRVSYTQSAYTEH